MRVSRNVGLGWHPTRGGQYTEQQVRPLRAARGAEPLDPLPDPSDPQVIVYTEYPGQAPQVVEDQITYPLTTALLAVPRSKVVRGFSFFGASFVYVVFEDGTDIYWARSRVLEYLNAAARKLPAGVTPTLPGTQCIVCWSRQAYIVTQYEQHNKIFRSGDSSNETIRLDFGCPDCNALARRPFARPDHERRRRV